MGESVKPVKNLNIKFSNKKEGGGGGGGGGGREKTVIYRNSPEKSWDFFKYQMTKQIASL